MSEKVVIIADPGIDTAFALGLAVHEPLLEVLAIVATAGNVSAEQATRNVHTLLSLIDPPGRLPRIGAALPIQYHINGTALHGPNGLGGVPFPEVELHHPTPGDKLLVEMIRQHPREVTIISLGPLSVLARAIDRDPETMRLVRRLICMGGTWQEPGNAGPVSEFHFACDPESARRVMHLGVPIVLAPLDITRKLVFSPTDLLNLPNPTSRTVQILRQIVPFGIRATANLYGVEGFHLKDVVGLIPLVRPAAILTRSVYVDVETRGELTRGMSVIDTRPNRSGTDNAELITFIDIDVVRDYITQTLSRVT